MNDEKDLKKKISEEANEETPVESTEDIINERNKGFQIGDRSVGYQFNFEATGVYLTIFPSEDDSVLFEMADMQKILAQYGTDDYDIVALSRVIRKASGEKEKLAEFFTGDKNCEEDSMKSWGNLNLDDGRPTATFHIEISRDKMTAKVKFDKTNGCQMPKPQQVIMELSRCNVVYGIDKDHINREVRKGIDFIAARGTEAIKGQDARIEKFYDASKRGTVTADEFDRVDFKNLNLFVLVKAGDVLARRIPHTEGTPGKDVFGNTIPAKSGRPKPVPAGKNTKIQNENDIVAAIDGQVIDGSMISVEAQFNVSGDVGVATGNIEFTGNVMVGGNVEQGFSVKATGDVEINGIVAGGEVEGLNIYIKGGVQGMNSGRVKAKNDITVSFIENAELEAGGTITVYDFALHSTLTAGHKIIVDGKRGIITGGILSAGEEVQAKIIGNDANVATRITVGENPMIKREYKDACNDFAEAKKRMDQLQKTLNTLEKIDIAKLPENRREQIAKLMRLKFPLAGEIERKGKLIASLEEALKTAGRGKIRVQDTIYPGVRLSINSVLKNMQTEQHCCTLSADGDNIKTGPF